jgi:hypothetical protein
MPPPLDRWMARLRGLARRWLPELFVRVTRKDVEQAEQTLSNLSDKEIEQGREAARRAIQEARRRDEPSSPPDA